MLSDCIVAADSGIIRRGKFVNLTGVAVEIKGQSEFRRHYFEIIKNFYEEYNINLPRFVLKTEDIIKLIPSYDLHEAHVGLTERLLKIENVTRIYVTDTFLFDKVDTIKGQIDGLDFLEKTLHNYYPIIPVWRYYWNYLDTTGHVALDGISGKITKAWKFIGKKAEKINIVPYGDLTYPCISLCDLICGYLGKTVHHFDAKEIFEQLKDRTPAFVKTEFVGDAEIEYLASDYPHSLKTERHFPHPLILIHKSKEVDNKIIRETDFFQSLLNFAGKEGGSVSFEDLVNQQIALQKGDCIICLDEEGYSKMKFVERLNPSREIKVLSVEEAYKLMDEKNKQTTL
ncbi:MAG: hypothetical protein JW878_09915 [Methanomicrobia archaeon]|nr:hypothetical protein [Methanomicrobia archaeon]